MGWFLADGSRLKTARASRETKSVCLETICICTETTRLLSRRETTHEDVHG